MAILQQIRTKFGLSASIPDSVALTQAEDDLKARIKKNRAAHAKIEAAIPGAVIASTDGAATERKKLEALDSEHGALIKAADATHREIAEALAREEAAERQARWAGVVESSTAPVIAAISEIETIVETLDGRLEQLLNTIGAFEAGLPWDPHTRRRTVTDYMERASRAADAVRASLRQAREIRSHVEGAKASAALSALTKNQQDDLIKSGERAA
jgi:pyruvoyl-dependent arginine decarboxylase (PvlArgDC)